MKKFNLPENRRPLVILATAFFLLIIFVLNYSLLTISSASSEEKAVYISNDNYFKEVKMAGGSKLLLLKRDSYNIEVSKDNRLTTYRRSLGFLWGNKLEIELKPQKASSYLGANELACARQNPEIVFYSCHPSTAGLILAEGQKAGSEDDDHDHSHAAEAKNASLSVAPYKTGFLEAKADGGSLSISLKNEKGQTASQPDSKIQDFKGRVSDSSFSVAADSGNFSAFDSSKNTIYNFKGKDDTNPANINISEEIESEQLSNRVIAARDHTYILSNNTVTDVHEEELAHDHQSAGQKLLVYNNSNNKLAASHEISEDWQILDLFNGPANQFLIKLGGDLNGETYLIRELEEPKKVELTSNTIQEACWKDPDTFYYMSDAGTNIFEYSISNEASYLIYDGLNEEMFVNGVNCVGDDLYFTIESNKDGDITGYAHYRFSDKNHNGVRLESELPFYFNYENYTFKAVSDKAGIGVNLVYGDQAGASANKPAISNHLIEQLKSKGVEADQQPVLFKY